MTNFGPMDTVPERYRDRKLYEHNPVVTLMRTSKQEAIQVGEFIVSKLRSYARNPNMIQVWLPKGGVSMLATPGGPFADDEADMAFFQVIKDGLVGSGIEVVEDDRAVNDAGFAHAIAEALMSKITPSQKSA